MFQSQNGTVGNEIRKLKTLEKNIAVNDTEKLVIYNKKWEKTHNNKDMNMILEIQRMKIFLT